MDVEAHLLSVFPAEIWNHLLECADDPKTRHRILGAFPELDNHFGRNLVAKCLFAEVLPLIAPQLSIKDILHCRTVCKLWHRDIHTLIAYHPYHIPYNEDPENGFPLNTVKINRNCPLFFLATSSPVLHIRTSHQLIQFLEMVQNHSGFPGRKIFGGTIFLDPSPNPNNSRELYEQCSLEMLKLFAPQIKKITMGSDSEFETALQFYKRLRLSLQLTPSLKSLCVNMEKQVDQRSLSLLIGRLPLPPLPELECFFYKIIAYRIGVVNYPRNICEALVASYVTHSTSSVRKFGFVAPAHMLPNKHVSLSKNITELELGSCERYNSYERMSIHIIFNHCIQKLSILNEESLDLIPNLKSISLLNVKVLDLRYATRISTSRNRRENVECPLLHTLYIKDWVSMSYRFLAGLTGLKKLEIWEPDKGSIMTAEEILRREEDQGDCEDDDLCGISRKVLRLFYDQENGEKNISEVWAEFPNLEQVVIHTRAEDKSWTYRKYLKSKHRAPRV